MKSSLTAIALLGALGATQAAGIPGQGTWETTLLPRDIDGDGGADAYYDTTLGITWMADRNASGRHVWDSAQSWAAGLDLHGVTGWRLPVAQAIIGYEAPGSELWQLWTVTLGNRSSLSNTGPFTGMLADFYWSGTAASDDNAYLWWNMIGFQTSSLKVGPYFAVAVHDGNVAAIPELPPWLLLAAGLPLLARRCGRAPAA